MQYDIEYHDLVNQHVWLLKKGGYRTSFPCSHQMQIRNNGITLQKLILMMAHYPELCPCNKKLDGKIVFKNGNMEDCRLCNLEIITSKKTSQYIGVSYNGIKWRSQCNIEKERFFLGYFSLEKDAAVAYVNFCNENKLYDKV